MRTLLLVTLTLSLAACGKERTMPPLSNVELKLAFTCTYEKDRLPALLPEADQLYRYARWLRKQQVEKTDTTQYPALERYYRIATAHGHYKANLDLRELIGMGIAYSPDPVNETLDLTQELIHRGIPGGYYDMGRYLKAGYGVKQDVELGNRYYRKAADLGSPEAQYAVGNMLTPLGPQSYAQKIGYEMLKCAAEQGNGEAAINYASYLQLGPKDFLEALKYFQLATKAGNELAPYKLELTFGPVSERGYSELGLQPDDERSRRYKAIGYILGMYSYAHPSVPEIDDIVPLPPAPLPPWDGKLKWLEDFKANVPPPQPSEELLTRLAHAKGLDPATGRPDPQAQQALRAQQAAEARFTPPRPDATPLGTICHSGERCPHSGLWQPLLPVASQHTTLAVWLHDRQPQNLALDQLFPAGQVARERSNRLLQNLRGPVVSTEAIRWQLLSYW